VNRKTLLILVAGVGAMLALSCAYQPSPPPNAEKIPGFFRGLLQGFMIFFSLI
jgi:hypothetical protein